MKNWQIVAIVLLAGLITAVVVTMMNKAKLKKAVEAGKLTVDKQDYTVIKVVAPVV